VCGILVTVGGSKAFSHRVLSPLRRRGPDGIGFWTDGRVSLAQTRLSILGLDERSQPPLENDTHVIVFNGEIYNFLEIARTVTSRPAPSDTRVLLDAWSALGPKVLPRLEGFWAFAVYEKATGKLTLCRDQFGVKPLYYSAYPGGFVASSTIEPILKSLPERPSLDFATMSEWARYQFTLSDTTFHRGIRRLMPGHLLEVHTRRENTWTPVSYENIWEIRGDRKADEEWVTDARNVLIRCVEDAATSDTPVTSTCSGGLDSSLVTRILGPEVAYHGNFSDPEVNETQWAKLAVEDTDTRLMVVNCREKFDLVERLDSLVEDFDAIAIGSVILPLDDLFGQVTRRFKVCLLGTGGDELFGGYNRYEMALGKCSQESYQSAFSKLTGDPWEKFEQLHAKGNTDLFRFYRGDTEVREAFLAQLKASDFSPHSAFLTFDRRFFLSGLLNIDDKMAGRFGLEGRPALLHQRFVRKVMELDPSELQGKAVLRTIARGILPDNVIDRTDKMGFTVPVGTMINENASRIRETLSGSRFRDLFNLRRARYVAKSKWDREVFGLALLDAWLRRYA
jgi:asparagine synthase (glutamine-hydrolysing)